MTDLPPIPIQRSSEQKSGQKSVQQAAHENKVGSTNRYTRQSTKRSRKRVSVQGSQVRMEPITEISDITSSQTAVPPERHRLPFDQSLLYITLTLCALGLVSVYTASARQAAAELGNSFALVTRQLVWMILGFGVLTIVAKFNFHQWRKYGIMLSAITIGLLVLTMLVGQTVNGSERWLMLPFGAQFQPSELAKLCTIFLMAQALCRKRIFTTTMILNLGLIGAMVYLVYQQPNLSNAISISILTLLMLFIGGLPVYWYAIGLPVGAVVVFQKIQQTEYQWRRIKGWIDPWKDAQDTGYNLIQSYFAIGSGGIFGRGLTHSVQKLYYLPFQHTDFIFAIICEELGIFGSLLTLSLFALFAWRGFHIAMHCPNRFGQLVAFGITASIVLQACINISVTTGVLPVTGVPLPLISYGGTSALITLFMVGILLSISRSQMKPTW